MRAADRPKLRCDLGYDAGLLERRAGLRGVWFAGARDRPLIRLPAVPMSVTPTGFTADLHLAGVGEAGARRSKCLWCRRWLWYRVAAVRQDLSYCMGGRSRRRDRLCRRRPACPSGPGLRCRRSDLLSPSVMVPLLVDSAPCRRCLRPQYTSECLANWPPVSRADRLRLAIDFRAGRLELAVHSAAVAGEGAGGRLR